MNNENDKSAVFPGFFRWQPAAWLKVTGEDSPLFLQGQLTNDLRGLEPGRAVYGLWLNQKGKVLADSFVVRGGAGEFWLASYASAAAAIRERLEAYVVADDVVIEDLTAAWRGVTLTGASRELAAVAPGAVSFPGRRGGGETTEWIFPAASEAAVLALLAGGREWRADEMTARRIAAGVPLVPVDIGPGDLPNEGGLETDALSYTKGCYLGQEVMARLKSMGQVRRRLVRVQGAGAPPPVPAGLMQAGRKVGELRSVVAQGENFTGLAMVVLLAVEVGRPLQLEGGAGDLEITAP